MQFVKALKKAKALIQQGWCQGAYARSSSGLEVFSDKDAVSYCVSGAIRSVVRHTEYDKFLLERALNLALPLLDRKRGLVNWNDSSVRTKEQVLCLFDKAIKLLEKKGEAYVNPKKSL